jgi:phosphatidylserine decarboxylase
LKKPFSAWKEGAPYYLPLIAIGGTIVVVSFHTIFVWPGAVVLFFGLFALTFFRDFPRNADAKPGDMVSPADGTIVEIQEMESTPYYDGPCKRVSIFLSVFNAHINRSPFDATVIAIQYKPGLFKDARRPDTSQINESNAIRLSTSHGPLTLRQISGAVARRIVCRASVGDTLTRGEKFGMIKFGSRTELYLPKTAEICVTLQEKVYAGQTIIGRFT